MGRMIIADQQERLLRTNNLERKMITALLRIIFFLIFTTHAFANSSNWLDQALRLQREIDLEAPLNETTFLGTHNSYNSRFYATATRYIDPNQTLSLTDQLNAGVRSLELDIHWTTNSNLAKDFLLCHGTATHLGCSIFDRKATEGFQEIAKWLKANPSEIILLYIERHVENHEPQLAKLLENYLGNFIYHPNSTTCKAIPTTLTKAEILKSGKPLLVVSKGCYQDSLAIRQEKWNDVVFTGIGNISGKSPTFIDANVHDFKTYPDCGKSDIFYADSKHNSLWRIFEDRTINGNANKLLKKITPETMSTLIRCGINWPTVDMLEKNDKRLEKAIWSWTSSFPAENQGHCAFYEINEGFKNTACEQIKTGFTCQEIKTREIKAVTMLGAWSSGETTCQLLAGKNWHFVTPVNGQQLNQLKISMENQLLQEVWLNYVEVSNGKWEVNARNIYAQDTIHLSEHRSSLR